MALQTSLHFNGKIFLCQFRTRLPSRGVHESSRVFMRNRSVISKNRERKKLEKTEKSLPRREGKMIPNDLGTTGATSLAKGALSEEVVLMKA
jgi:hypothetical protein